MTKEESLNSKEGAVVNFRPALGLKDRVYRSGSPDALATVVQQDNIELTESERIFLYDITLNVDLRSSSTAGEVDEELSSLWTNRAPGGAFEVTNNIDDLKNDSFSRVILRVDLITNIMRYTDKHWLTDIPPEVLQDHDTAMTLRMKEIGKRGLPGLYEAILEGTSEGILVALQATTSHLEKAKSNKVSINCTQGKDRTGVVIMLLQSALDVSDDDIIADFVKSELSEKTKHGSAALDMVEARMKFDRKALGGAPPQAMEATLAKLRKDHGSIPGYLDSIGFDESWRKRLADALK